MRLIDADAIIQAVCTKLGIKDKKFLLQSEKAIVDVILNAPTVDAVSAVRCKDCKYYDKFPTWSACTYWNGDPYEQASVNADDFCSYGEVRDE